MDDRSAAASRTLLQLIAHRKIQVNEQTLGEAAWSKRLAAERSDWPLVDLRCTSHGPEQSHTAQSFNRRSSARRWERVFGRTAGSPSSLRSPTGRKAGLSRTARALQWQSVPHGRPAGSPGFVAATSAARSGDGMGARRPPVARHVVAGAIVAGYPLATVLQPVASLPSWLALPLLALGAATNAVLTWSRHFAQAWCTPGMDRSGRCGLVRSMPASSRHWPVPAPGCPRWPWPGRRRGRRGHSARGQRARDDQVGDLALSAAERCGLVLCRRRGSAGPVAMLGGLLAAAPQLLPA